MSEITDIQSARKKRKRKQMLRRTAVFAAVAAAGMALFLLRDVFNFSAIGDFFEDLLVPNNGGFPVTFEGAVPESVAQWGNYVSVITDMHMAAYSSSGREKASVQHGFGDPVADYSKNRAVLYSRGGNQLRVESTSKTLFKQTVDGQIFTAKISSKNYVAVAATSEHAASQLIVYNNNMKQVWRCTREQYITSISFSPDSNGIAVGCVQGDNGAFKSIVYLFRFDKEEEIAKIELNETMVYQVYYNGSNDVIAVCDDRLVHIGKNGQVKTAYEYESGEMMQFHLDDRGNAALLLGDYAAKKSSTLVLLDSDGVLKSKVDVKASVRDLMVYKKSVHVLTDRQYLQYDFDGNQKQSEEIATDGIAVFAGSPGVFLLTMESLEKIG